MRERSKVQGDASLDLLSNHILKVLEVFAAEALACESRAALDVIQLWRDDFLGQLIAGRWWGDDHDPIPYQFHAEIEQACKTRARWRRIEAKLLASVQPRPARARITALEPAASTEAARSIPLTKRSNRVQQFLASVNKGVEESFGEADIWRVGGYQDDRPFQDWKKGKSKDGSGPDRNFSRVLDMELEKFREEALKKRKKNS